jgi:flagellar hook-associated protein 1 FlgK
MADLLNIGVNGLLAYQRSLSTTSHNIANVNTEGYRRQRVDLSTLPPQFTGAGFEGSGVQVDGVSRAYDQFIESQLTTNTSLYKQQELMHTFASNLDNLLADSQVGLSPVLQSFFKSLQDLSTDPSSTPTRQVVLSEAAGMTSVFKDTHARLEDLQTGINLEVSTAVDQINSLSESIARLNKDILFAKGVGNNTAPNDLLDQRQTKINELAELVSVKTVSQDDGSINVFIGKGHSLVVGTKNQSLAVAKNIFDATRLEVGLAVGTSTVNISGQITGGKLGGALSFRNDMLDDAYNQLGRLAMALSEDMNAQHRLGYNLDDEMGTNFFTDLGTTTSRGSSNNATATDHLYSATVSDSNLLVASDYRLDYSSGGTYTLTRMSDNSVVGSSTSLATLSTTVSASEGFAVALTSGTSIAVGDSFLLSPVRDASRDMGVALSDTNKIAAASPLLASRAATNAGNVAFASDGLLSSSGSLPASAISFTFNSATNEFTASPAAATTPAAATIAYDPATDSGTQYQVTLAGVGDYQFTVTGTPANGDVISVGINNGGSGDNRNMLAMIGLQEQKLIGNSSANYQEAYSELVSEVGVKTRRAEFSRDANQILYERTVSSQQEVSGVNLDEEAADLIRFQQAYQAVARIITTADDLFQTLLGAVSR